jgi:SAM-dependent methyltransferase
MNQAHLELLASPGWERYLREDLLPWVLGAIDLGDDVLEIGPGPGLTTDLLRARTATLTAVEIDSGLAAALAARLDGTNVIVVEGDATDLDLPAGRFSAVTCFTMLHHVPSPSLQDALFLEVARVLRPGGAFVGTDATDSPALRALHIDDVFVPVEADDLARRLRAAGLEEVIVVAEGDRLRFVARRPARAVDLVGGTDSDTA